jgi:hypothetical protein
VHQSDLPYFSPHSDDERDPYYILPLKPPIALEGVSARVFPLRANIDMLQRFVEEYMNFVPPEVGRFRAVMPYVHLMMLDYGKLAVEATNLGWFAQREFLFCVPVEWYTVECGEWIFKDWASITPFIYVDSDASMTLGRTVYGWTKNIATVSSTLEPWMHDPLAPISCATISTQVFPDLYRGSSLEERVFFEVERQHEMSNFQLPFDPLSPIAPWVMASNAMEAFFGFNRDAVGMLRGFGVVPMHDGTSGDNFQAMMSRMMQVGFPLRPDFTFNTLNLKQFRQSDAPWKYCYQALTNARMKITKLNGTGLLGEQRQLLGDVSGGYSIKIHDWPSLPIVGTLGLEVSRRWQGQDADVVELEPVLPFWYDVNMDYERGRNLAYRGHDGVWHESPGCPLPQTGPVDASARRFNTTLGASIPAVAGPFTFSDTTIRVLPLLAKREKLEKFLDEYLNHQLAPAKQEFRLWGGDMPGYPDKPDKSKKDEKSDYAYVYLTATSFGDMTSETNNIGDWAKYELAFLVPVQRWHDGQLAGVGLVPAFTYVDKTTAAVSRSEVTGIPTSRAGFTLPEATWMSKDGPGDSEQQFLKVDAEVLPALGEGQKAEMRSIVETSCRNPDRARSSLESRVTDDRWCDVLKEELTRKLEIKQEERGDVQSMLALALELLGNNQPFALFTLKQFRDVSDPDRACYQALVRVSRAFRELHDLREIEQPLAVTVHDFPTQQLCKRLGLVGAKLSEDPSGIAWELEPVRPFWVRVTLTEGLGEPLLWRSGGTWDEAKEKIKSYLDDQENIKVGSGAVMSLEVGDPRRLEQVTHDLESKIQELPEARRRIDDHLKAAEEKLKELEEAQSNLDDAEAKLAEAKLVEARRKVEDLKAPEETIKALEDARLNLEKIELEFEKAQSTHTKAETKLEEAKRDLAIAKAELKDVEDGETPGSITEAKAKVEAAKRDVQKATDEVKEAKAAHVDQELRFNTAGTEFATAEARVAEPALANLAKAEAKLAGLKSEFLMLADAQKAIKAVDPQVVIETILSREWGSWDARARWKKGLTDIRERHRKAVEWQGGNTYSVVQARAEHAFFDRYETGVYALPRLKDFLDTPYNDGKKLFDLAKEMKEQYLKLTRRMIEMTKHQTNLYADGLWELTPTRRYAARYFYDPIVTFLIATRDFDRFKLIAPGDTRRNTEYLNENAREAGALLDALHFCDRKHRFADLFLKFRADDDTATQKKGRYQPPGPGGIGDPKPRPPRVRTAEQLSRNAYYERHKLYETVRWPSVQQSLDDEANRMRDRWEAQREALFTLLSGAWVKPDFVVRRDAAGSTRDNEGTTRRDWIFPLTQSWDEDWYAGLLQQEPPLPSTAEG